MKISKFVRDAENGPNDCLSCDDEYNGIYYGWIIVKGVKIYIHLCYDCLKKLRRKNARRTI